MTMMNLRVKIDNVEYEVEDRPVDHIAYSTAARRHKWPTSMNEDPLLFAYFVSYSAMKRAGHISADTGWQSYLDRVESIDFSDEDTEGEGEALDPTETAN